MKADFNIAWNFLRALKIKHFFFHFIRDNLISFREENKESWNPFWFSFKRKSSSFKHEFIINVKTVVRLLKAFILFLSEKNEYNSCIILWRNIKVLRLCICRASVCTFIFKWRNLQLINFVQRWILLTKRKFFSCERQAIKNRCVLFYLFIYLFIFNEMHTHSAEQTEILHAIFLEILLFDQWIFLKFFLQFIITISCNNVYFQSRKSCTRSPSWSHLISVFYIPSHSH